MCNKSYTKESHLKRHKLVHSREAEEPKSIDKKEKNMECEFCDRVFKYKKSFTHHMLVEHGMSDDNDLQNVLVAKSEYVKNESIEDESMLK